MKKILLLLVIACYAFTSNGQNSKIAYQLFANGPVVKLYKKNNSNNKYVLTDSVSNSPHYGTFNGLDSGTYLLRAVYSGSKYIPTFYPDKGFWTDATPIVLINSTDSFYANVNSLAAISNPGLASAIGQLTEGMMKRNAAGDKMANIQVNLIDSADRILGVSFTDANGNFSFQNIGYGTYKVKPEIVNVSISTPPQIQLTPSNPNATVNLTVHNNGTLFTSVTYPDSPNKAVVTAYPNPCSQSLRLQFSQVLKIHVRLSDVTGKTCLEKDLLSSEEIDMSDIAPGLYFLHWNHDADGASLKVIRQ